MRLPVGVAESNRSERRGVESVGDENLEISSATGEKFGCLEGCLERGRGVSVAGASIDRSRSATLSPSEGSRRPISTEREGESAGPLVVGRGGFCILGESSGSGTIDASTRSAFAGDGLWGVLSSASFSKMLTRSFTSGRDNDDGSDDGTEEDACARCKFSELAVGVMVRREEKAVDTVARSLWDDNKGGLRDSMSSGSVAVRRTGNGRRADVDDSPSLAKVAFLRYCVRLGLDNGFGRPTSALLLLEEDAGRST